MRVIIESPFHGKDAQDRKRNEAYLLACLRDSVVNHRESPFASHGFYPQFLDEDDPLERELGIACNLDWMDATKLVAVYGDRGISEGMKLGIEHAKEIDVLVEYRELGPPWQDDDQALQQGRNFIIGEGLAGLS